MDVTALADKFGEAVAGREAFKATATSRHILVDVKEVHPAYVPRLLSAYLLISISRRCYGLVPPGNY